MHWEYSNDSGEKKNNLLHFYGFSGLIELILLGKAKLSMASCLDIKVRANTNCPGIQGLS